MTTPEALLDKLAENNIEPHAGALSLVDSCAVIGNGDIIPQLDNVSVATQDSLTLQSGNDPQWTLS